jgi:PAS domain S-box-containing protein
MALREGTPADGCEEFRRCEFSEDVIQNMAEGLLVQDAGGVTAFVNPAAASLLGYTPDELIGRHWTLITPPDQREKVQEADELRTFGTWSRYELELLAKDGQRVPVLVSGCPVFQDGVRKWNVAVFTDTRELRAAERAAAQAQARLYELAQNEIAERRANEEKLRSLTEELTRSNRELELFAYVASHDLQEPLRMIGSYVQLIARRYKGKLDEDADEFIGFAVDGATRMQRMINDLLAYSRVGTKGKPFSRTAMDKVWRQATSNLQVAIEERGATVTSDHLPEVMGDDVQLVQLVQNLVGNAVKFCRPPINPVVHVSCREESDSWVFSIRDNGIGIDPEHFERVFLIFQRLHDRTEFPGTGIGLALCRKIVERHGGRIWVESAAGKGATFFFTLPRQVH